MTATCEIPATASTGPSGAFESVLSEEFRRERTTPRAGDPLYLHLSDLSLALRRFASDAPLRVLDYGCGASPYSWLFPNAEYRRADVLDAPALDYRIAPDQSIAERSSSFDVVLSTQVLEHVADPAAYLVECRRLLRPGGTLLLSTHGMYEEHGLPYDFLRWTSNGLRAQVERAGLTVQHCYRMTANGRAMAFLVEQHGGMLVRSRRRPFAFIFWCVHSLIRSRRRWFHVWCDAAFSGLRVVDASASRHSLCIALLCVATKATTET